MIGKSKKIFAMLFSLLLAASLLFIPFSESVSAESGERDILQEKIEALSGESSSDEDGGASGQHADPSTFQKNFDLSAAQKEYTITEIERVVSEKLTPEMSDLEKYYTLAVEARKLVVYDWDFWNGGYYFDYYSHQWDSYGAIKPGELSVCVGIAIFYSHLCHAADLPCLFVRLYPDYLDHTISYIPDINGNAYYADVTENSFLMAGSSSGFEGQIDKEFSHITKDCTDTTFDYKDKHGNVQSTDIKKCYNKPYSDWFREYALHKNTKKKFLRKYVEKGSGEAGKHYASYQDFDKYPAQPYVNRASDVTGIWFLDDFYMEPADIKDKILNKEFDKQLLDISGVKKNYDCDSLYQLKAAIEQDLSVRYFPSSENGKIVAKYADLRKGVDYRVKCKDYDAQTKTAVVTIEGRGAYSGTHQIEVKLHSAVAVEEPVCINKVPYNGKPQDLVVPGVAEGGEMQYALGTTTEATGDYSAAVPTAVNAGKYQVWYRIVGTDGHTDMQPQRIEKAAYIKKAENPVAAKGKTAKVNYKKLKKKSQKLKASRVIKVHKAEGKVSYLLDSAKKGKKNFEKSFRVNVKTGQITVKKGLKKGTYKVKVGIIAKGNKNYNRSDWKAVTFRVRVK